MAETQPHIKIIDRSGNHVATASRVSNSATMGQELGIDGVDKLSLLFFSHIELTPPTLFEHMAGRGLMAFLDGCSLQYSGKEDDVGPLKYVHGRSEVMTGRHDVTSVLLCMVLEGEIADMDLMVQLPNIYEKFIGRPRHPKK